MTMTIMIIIYKSSNRPAVRRWAVSAATTQSTPSRRLARALARSTADRKELEQQHITWPADDVTHVGLVNRKSGRTAILGEKSSTED